MATAALHIAPGHVLNRIRRPALIVGAIGLAACVAGWIVDPTQFFRAYLVAYLFWTGVTLGCLAILMLQHVTGGTWGAVIRRLLESGSRLLPMMAVLFVPIAVGVRHLYEWARPEVVAGDAVLQFKSLYLNVPFFLVRAAIYFVAWIVVARLLNAWSLDQDRTAAHAPVRRMELLSRGGLVLYGFTITYASVDWIMSLAPHWYSTIFPLIVMGGQAVSAFGLVIPVFALLVIDGPLHDVITAKQFQDLGNLLLAFVMLWAYFAFSQYLLIWCGNLKEEIPWYLPRTTGPWYVIALLLMVFHFSLPFVLLLMRGVKRRPQVLMCVAVLLFIIHYFDVFWLVLPSFSHDRIPWHWLDLASVIGLGGLWIGAFLWQLTLQPLLPINDPALP